MIDDLQCHNYLMFLELVWLQGCRERSRDYKSRVFSFPANSMTVPLDLSTVLLSKSVPCTTLWTTGPFSIFSSSRPNIVIPEIIHRTLEIFIAITVAPLFFLSFPSPLFVPLRNAPTQPSKRLKPHFSQFTLSDHAVHPTRQKCLRRLDVVGRMTRSDALFLLLCLTCEVPEGGEEEEQCMFDKGWSRPWNDNAIVDMMLDSRLSIKNWWTEAPTAGARLEERRGPSLQLPFQRKIAQWLRLFGGR